MMGIESEEDSVYLPSIAPLFDVKNHNYSIF